MNEYKVSENDFDGIFGIEALMRPLYKTKIVRALGETAEGCRNICERADKRSPLSQAIALTGLYFEILSFIPKYINLLIKRE